MTECVQRRQRNLGVNHPHFISFSIALVEWETEGASTGKGSTAATTAISVAENEIVQRPFELSLICKVSGSGHQLLGK